MCTELAEEFAENFVKLKFDIKNMQKNIINF